METVVLPPDQPILNNTIFELDLLAFPVDTHIARAIRKISGIATSPRREVREAQQEIRRKPRAQRNHGLSRRKGQEEESDQQPQLNQTI